jgi:hypothetical protein
MSLALAISTLRDAFPNQEFPDRSVAFYGRALADLDDRAVSEAVVRLINGPGRFRPTIGEIRREVAEGQLSLPSPEEAWDIAQRGSLRNAAPEVQAAAEAVGGRWAILHAENPATIHAQFLKDYAGRRETALLVCASAQVPVAPPPEMIALGPTMASLPETERVRPRPVMERLMARWAGRNLGTPSDEEKHDAIEVLRGGTWAADPVIDPLYAEAERIFAEVADA